jgi:hypothetical protein
MTGRGKGATPLNPVSVVAGNFAEFGTVPPYNFKKCRLKFFGRKFETGRCSNQNCYAVRRRPSK